MATTTKASPAAKTGTTKKTAAAAVTKTKTAAKAKSPATDAAVKKTAAKAAPKAAKSTAAAPKRSAAAIKAVKVATDRRRHYVEVAAYYIAERRGFVGGNAAEDWKAAEAEIDRLLAEGKLNG